MKPVHIKQTTTSHGTSSTTIRPSIRSFHSQTQCNHHPRLFLNIKIQSNNIQLHNRPSSSLYHVTTSSLDQTRKYCTTNAQNQPNQNSNDKPLPLKTMLKKFYLKVHPDFFTAFPDHKVPGSFLDEFSSIAKNGVARGGITNSQTRKIEFYFRKPEDPKTTDSKVEDAKSIDTGAPKQEDPEKIFAKVTGTLFGINTTEPIKVQLQRLEKMLGRVFKQCGLDHPFTIEDYFEGQTGGVQEASEGLIEDSLINFLQDYGRLARHKLEQSKLGVLNVTFQSNLFWMQHRIRIGYELPSFIQEPATEVKLLLLQKIKQLMEEINMEGGQETIEQTLNGVTVMFATSTRLDNAGRVCLNYIDEKHVWKALLKSLTREEIERRKKIHEERENLELAISKKLGIAHIYCDYEEQNLDSYTTMLGNIEKAINSGQFGINKSGNGIFSETLNDLSLRTTKLYNTTTGDEKNGVLIFPFHKFQDPQYVHEQILSKGPPIVAAYRTNKVQIESFEKAVMDVKRKFRLYRLYYNCDQQQAANCIGKLLKNADRLNMLLWSQRLNISNRYHLNDDGTLDIKWNFDL